MAYTRAWTNTTPADTDQASTLGAVTRNLRTDIDERMNTLLGAGQWDVDPVAGFPVTKIAYISPLLGYPSPTPGSPDVQNTWFPDFSIAGDQYSMGAHAGVTKLPWNVPFRVPVGATVTKIRAALRVSSSIATSIEASAFVAGIVVAPALVSLGSVAAITVATALAWYDFAIASHVVVAEDSFVTVVKGFGNAHYHGLEITYTVPNLLVAS